MQHGGDDYRGGLGGLVVREPSVSSKVLAQANRGEFGFSDRELDAIRAGEAHVVEHEGRFRVAPLIRGSALGQGAVYARNLPAPGSYTVDPVIFAAKTSKNRKTYPGAAHPGMGASLAIRVDAVGVVSRLILMFEGTYTSAAAAATLTSQWPWNLAKSVVVSANGINNLFSCDGADLRAFMRVRNGKYFLDRESSFANPAAAAAGTIRLFWEIPLAYDESLIGAIFAQTEETFLNVTIQTAQNADLFSANPGAFSNSNWKLIAEYYSIPTVDTKAGRILVIPDITQLHGVVSRDDALTANGDHVAPLTRTGGILLRTLQRADNSTTGGIGNVDPTASITSHRFRYGGNVVPVDVPGSALRLFNAMDYGDAVIPTQDVVSGATPPAYMVDDYVVDSPLRDAIHLSGITEAQMINTFSGVAVVAGAKVHTVQEAMVAG